MGKITYPDRYMYGKKKDVTSDDHFEELLLRAKFYREERRMRSMKDPRIKDINIEALLSILWYFGLRIGEIVGDIPRKYLVMNKETKIKDITKTSKGHEGILKEDVEIEGSLLKITSDEPLKHGERTNPLYAHLNKPGVYEIIEVWKETLDRRDRLFPIGKKLAWLLVTESTKKVDKRTGEVVEYYYPHYFRLNRATKFLNQPETTILEMQEWFGWTDPRTIKEYKGHAGETTKKMADRL